MWDESIIDKFIYLVFIVRNAQARGNVCVHWKGFGCPQPNNKWWIHSLVSHCSSACRRRSGICIICLCFSDFCSFSDFAGCIQFSMVVCVNTVWIHICRNPDDTVEHISELQYYFCRAFFCPHNLRILLLPATFFSQTQMSHCSGKNEKLSCVWATIYCWCYDAEWHRYDAERWPTAQRMEQMAHNKTIDKICVESCLCQLPPFATQTQNDMRSWGMELLWWCATCDNS